MDDCKPVRSRSGDASADSGCRSVGAISETDTLRWRVVGYFRRFGEITLLLSIGLPFRKSMYTYIYNIRSFIIRLTYLLI